MYKKPVNLQQFSFLEPNRMPVVRGWWSRWCCWESVPTAIPGVFRDTGTNAEGGLGWRRRSGLRPDYFFEP